VKSPSDVRSERVKSFVAPVVPAIMVGLAFANLWIWGAHWLRDRPNLDQVATIAAFRFALLLIAAWYVRRVARAGRTEATGICLIAVAAVSSVTLCLITYYNGNGVVQSMPLSIILPLLAIFFWPRTWHFVAGTVLSLAPPLVQLFVTDHSTNERFMFGQLALATVVVTAVMYYLVVRANRSIAQMSADIEYRAAYDGLTGLHNRSHWFERVTGAYATCQAAGRPAALLFLDIDRFKQHNDQIGHVEGDRLLRNVATVLSEASAPDHILGRFGGDEFIVFMPNTTQVEADDYAARIRQAAARLETTAGNLAISIGAKESLPGEDLDQFISRADHAMFAAKAIAHSVDARASAEVTP
jgi:diguanylate cyclase (GGDEF)-like protein